MNPPTATPRTDAAWSFAFTASEFSAASAARQMRDKCAELETELAAAQQEAAHYMSVAQKATDELARLRAELKELSQAYELNKVSIDELDADRARAERAEAECVEQARGRLRAEAELDGIRALADRRNKRPHVEDTTHQLVAALDQALEIGQAERDCLRAEVERLTKQNRDEESWWKEKHDYQARAERAEAEVERLTKQIKDDNRSYGCELRDPNGTIWEQAAKDRARAERAEAALAFIASNGGTTHETECGAIACNGSWCAEQARAALDATMKGTP